MPLKQHDFQQYDFLITSLYILQKRRNLVGTLAHVDASAFVIQ